MWPIIPTSRVVEGSLSVSAFDGYSINGSNDYNDKGDLPGPLLLSSPLFPTQRSLSASTMICARAKRAVPSCGSSRVLSPYLPRQGSVLQILLLLLCNEAWISVPHLSVAPGAQWQITCYGSWVLYKASINP